VEGPRQIGSIRSGSAQGTPQAACSGLGTRRIPLPSLPQMPEGGHACPEWVMIEPLPPIPSHVPDHPAVMIVKRYGALRHGTLGGR